MLKTIFYSTSPLPQNFHSSVILPVGAYVYIQIEFHVILKIERKVGLFLVNHYRKFKKDPLHAIFKIKINEMNKTIA